MKILRRGIASDPWKNVAYVVVEVKPENADMATMVFWRSPYDIIKQGDEIRIERRVDRGEAPGDVLREIEEYLARAEEAAYPALVVYRRLDARLRVLEREAPVMEVMEVADD